MTNYDKNRKRQNGRQDSPGSKYQIGYNKGFVDGQSQLIRRFIDSVILPEVNFDLSKPYRNENE